MLPLRPSPTPPGPELTSASATSRRGCIGPFVQRHEFADVGDEAVSEREILAGAFGLIPHWAKDAAIARCTYNARSKTVREKPSFRDAWKVGRF